MVNAQYQVTQEQAVTAAINTIRYNGQSNITSSNVEKNKHKHCWRLYKSNRCKI